MSRFIEAKERDLIELTLLGPECERRGQIKLAGTLEDFPRFVPRMGIWTLIDIRPIRRRIGPDHQPKPLHQAIATSAPKVRTTDVFDDARWLRVAEHAQGHCLDVQVSAHYAVERIGLLASPARQIEATSYCLLVAIEVLEQRYQLVALDQNARWVADKQFPKRFVA